ncbi:hypothetical protein A5752_21140 [Mycobacterium sp. 852002-51961_SCH5331710]|nr:hypothetical protein A5752_21140 [Mycobacterium sp. 852002-51961_SCH5331710]
MLFGAGGAIASADETGSGAGGGSTGTSQSSGTTTGAESSGTTSSVTTGSSTSTQPKLDRRFRLRIPDFSRLSPSRQQSGFTRPTSIFRGGVDRNAKTNATTGESKKDATTEESKATETVPGDSEGTPGAEQQGAEAGVQTLPTEDQTAGNQELSTETESGTEGAVSTVPADGSGTQDTSNSSLNSEAGSAASQTETTNVSAPLAPGLKPGPLTNAFVTINGAVVTWSESLAALPTSKMPVFDAITSLQTMVTTVVGAVTRVPSDFYSMLGIPVSSGPPQSLIGGSGTLDVRKVDAPTGGPFVAPHAVEAPHVVAPADGSLFGTMAPRVAPGKVTTSGTVQPLSVSGTASLAPAAAPASARSIFEHVIEAVLVPASLTALAAIALPGVGALLVVAAAGVRVGYRQAKAGLALRASGIARFAGSGPLGVVRSGSMVALRQRARGPRTKRAVCPEAERAARGLEHVA